MRKLVLILIILTAFCNLRGQAGNVSVKTWYDDSKSAFSFTFDDGYISHYNVVRPMLNNYGFKGTFYVISGFLNESLPGIWRYGTWEQFREMAAEGHEIAAHTVNHPDLRDLSVGSETTEESITYELYQSKRTIEEKIPGYPVISVAYPFTYFNSSVLNVTKNYYEAGRIGTYFYNSASLSEADRFKIKSYCPHFNTPRDLITDDDEELQEFKSFITEGIAGGKWSTLMAHEVYPMYEISAIMDDSYYPLATEWLNEFCIFLKEKSDNRDVWVATLADVLRYMRERDSFASSVIASSDTLIEITATDALDNNLYAHPLTVDISVPAEWDTVLVTYNGNSIIYASIANGASNYIRTEIVPDKGNIILEKYETEVEEQPVQKYSIAGVVTYSDASLTPLKDIKINLTDSTGTEIQLTGADGSFIYTEKPAGSYNINCSAPETWDGVNSTDALLALLYFSDSVVLDSLQQLAADVNNDSKINATDALLILRRFSGLINSFAKPDWLFEPAQINLDLINANANYQFKSIITGDLNRSYKQ